MARIGNKYKKVVELFNEKTGEVVRVIRFRNTMAFNDFLNDFKVFFGITSLKTVIYLCKSKFTSMIFFSKIIFCNYAQDT